MEEVTSAQLWWFLPTLPSEYEEFLKRSLEQALFCIRDPKRADLANLGLSHASELIPLLKTIELKQTALSECSTDDYIWTAELNFDTWSESELTELKQLSPNNAHSPLKYWVELSISHASNAIYSCQLSPAELKLMTLMDPDLGRRIGDELDGQRPNED